MMFPHIIFKFLKCFIYSFMIQNYPIPREIRNALMSGFRYWRGISNSDRQIVDRAKFVITQFSLDTIINKLNILFP